MEVPMPCTRRAASARVALFLGMATGLLAATTTASLAIEILAQPDPLNTSWLSVPDTTRTRLRSGFDFKDGNIDSGNLLRVEPAGSSFESPGAAWVLFDASGPGVVTSIWFTGKSRQGKASIGGRLNFFFDDEPQPALSGDLPALLESGVLAPKPLAEKSSGGWVCYAPIYFARRLKITLTGALESYTVRTNSLGQRIPHLYHQLSYQLLKSPVTSSSAESLRHTAAWSRPVEGKPVTQTVSLAPNESRVVATLTGQGIVQSLRLRFESGDPDTARLRIHADGQKLLDLQIPEFWGFSRQARRAAHLDSPPPGGGHKRNLRQLLADAAP